MELARKFPKYDDVGAGLDTRFANLANYTKMTNKPARAIQILLVEDYEPIRLFIRKKIETRSDFQIVHEATDGLNAVRWAEVLQPDLVLLDVGLPILGGIEVARRLQEVAVFTKIIFVSGQSDPEIVRDGFNAVTRGYVLKTDVGEILTASDTVLRGQRFVSSSLILSGYESPID